MYTEIEVIRKGNGSKSSEDTKWRRKYEAIDKQRGRKKLKATH
jgi:hypothetical protein